MTAMKSDELSVDYLKLGEVFTGPTLAAIREYYERMDWQEVGYGTFLQPADCCLMFFRLRHMPDELFPRGKWATIQQLESQIETLTEVKP